MRTLLICHADDTLNRVGLARWLASFSNLTGIVAIQETKRRLWKRVRREIRRVGPLNFLNVLAFRAHYSLFLNGRDRQWERAKLAQLCDSYRPLPQDTRLLHTHSPNTTECEAFIRNCAPDIVIARCKTLLKESVFLIPAQGTFVMHPGICPQYRNAHGCFWALAQDDLDNVGMTLLKIDKGVDTGPVFGYYRCSLDEPCDSHIVIQHKVVFDNLESLRERLQEIHSGQARPVDTTGRPSREWGQPWLTSYLSWRWRARRRPA